MPDEDARRELQRRLGEALDERDALRRRVTELGGVLPPERAGGAGTGTSGGAAELRRAGVGADARVERDDVERLRRRVQELESEAVARARRAAEAYRALQPEDRLRVDELEGRLRDALREPLVVLE